MEGNPNMDLEKSKTDTAEPSLSPKRGELSQMIRETVRGAVKSAVEDIKAEEKRLRDLKRKKRSCKYCKATFSLKWNYKVHLKKQHPENYKQTKCKLCGKKFKTRTDLISHEATHNTSLIESRLHRETAETYCENTHLMFPYRKHYDELYYKFSKLSESIDEDEYSYAMESRLFRFDPYRRQLLVKLTKVKPSYCKTCGYFFESKKKLEEHKSSEKHKELEGGITEIFGDEDLQTDEGADINIAYFCRFCNKEFLVEEEYKRHVVLQHSERKAYDCQYCSFHGFYDMEQLLFHFDLQHRKEIALFNCSKCTRIFQTASECERHIQNVHGNIKKDFKCVICGMEFFTLRSLRSHFYIAHQEKQRKCDMCTKPFKTTGDLKRHQEESSHLTLHTCPSCGVCFATRVNLEMHMTEIHGKIYTPKNIRAVGRSGLEVSQDKMAQGEQRYYTLT